MRMTYFTCKKKLQIQDKEITDENLHDLHAAQADLLQPAMEYRQRKTSPLYCKRYGEVLEA